MTSTANVGDGRAPDPESRTPAPGDPTRGTSGGPLSGVPYPRAFLALTLALLVAVIGLAAYLLLREPEVLTRIVPQPAAMLPPAVIARAEELERMNRELEAQIKALELDIGTATCPPGTSIRTPAPRTQAPSSGPPTVATTPLPGDPAGASPAAMSAPQAPPTDPTPAVAPPAGPDAPVLSNRDMRDRLEKATVLILSDDTIATGFFISERMVVTNRHAVENAPQSRVFLASRALGQVRRASVVRATAAGETGAPDFALLRMEEGNAPGTLAIGPAVEKLSAVTAAGYPGLTVLQDSGFRRLIGGDMRAAPDLNMTQGAVQSVQTSTLGIENVVHTASILQGNSGGPLLDACGRVIGVNTFIAVDQEQSGRISYAQSAANLLVFLRGAGVRLAPDARRCPN